MWIERLGGTDEKVFYGFCVVVGIILLLTLANFIITFFAGESPGHSVSFLFDASVVLICVSILFRGIQTSWTSDLYVYRIICQVYTAINFVGYTLFTSVLCVKSWAYISAFLVKKRCPKWCPLVIVTVLLFISGIAIIVWEILFTPKVMENSQMTEVNPYNQTILECIDSEEKWSRHNSTNYFQFWWRVSASTYIGVITLVDIISIPVLFCVSLPLRFEWLQAKHRALIMVQVNGSLCLLSGILIWFVYQPTVDAPERDNRMYIIIGCLQLWKLFYTQLSLLVARALSVESCSCCALVDYSSGHDSTGRLISTREMATLDRNSRGALSVHDLEIYAPRGRSSPPPAGAIPNQNQAGYMNLPPDRTDNDTNTRRFRY